MSGASSVGGNLILGNGGNFTSTLTFSSSTGSVVYNGTTTRATFGSLALVGDREFNVADGPAGIDLTVTGVLSGTGRLIKTGAGPSLSIKPTLSLAAPGSRLAMLTFVVPMVNPLMP